MDLVKRKCEPCVGGVKPLSPNQAKDLAVQVPEWRLGTADPRILRDFTFKNFRTAMKFVIRVAALAEEEGHHPDIHIHYNRVEFVLWTHDIGGLSENDFILAAKIDRLRA
jgi:4a-hydroxytetrahydrobiopterin dehydratase